MQAVFADLPDTDDQVHPCRPTISCTADITAPGRLEVEAGGLYASAAGHTLSFPILLKLSLTPLVQLQVGSNGYTLVNGVDGAAPARYLDNVFLGPKLHLHDQGGLWPSLALSAQVSVPTFGADGHARLDDLFATAFASKDFAFVHVDWNVGALVWRVNDSPVTQAFTALALSASLPAPFGAAIEGYYFSNAAPLAPRDGGIRAVANVTARSWMVLDVGADVGFFPSTRAYSLFLGVTLVPVAFWRTDETESR
jgi:hypothetical protein